LRDLKDNGEEIVAVWIYLSSDERVTSRMAKADAEDKRYDLIVKVQMTL